MLSRFWRALHARLLYADSSADVLRLQFTAASTNCGAITLDFQEDGFDVYITDQLGPGDSTPMVNVGPVIPGTHLLTVQATGVEGGVQRRNTQLMGRNPDGRDRPARRPDHEGPVHKRRVV